MLSQDSLPVYALMAAFVLIWAALIVYSGSMLNGVRARRAAALKPAE